MRLRLRNHQSPGDIVMLTAAVRDLHRAWRDRFITDVDTSCPDLWRYNPHVTTLSPRARAVRTIECQYPLVHQSNRFPGHFLHGFADFLAAELGVQIPVSDFRGDIHLSPAERNSQSPLAHLLGVDAPFWILAAGGKFDFTIKWWSPSRYQAVVDHFRGRITFVQVGESGHFHPPLRGVLDWRGRTSLRDLVLLVHHAAGVVCPVTALMHLAAAVPVTTAAPSNRPCVVIAGGREPVTWEAYPGHQFIHTIGALPCCLGGGCWRSRTLPLGDGDEKDAPGQCCIDVVDALPRCMDLISAAEVIRRIELYLAGGVCRPLTAAEHNRARPSLRRSDREEMMRWLGN